MAKRFRNDLFRQLPLEAYRCSIVKKHDPPVSVHNPAILAGYRVSVERTMIKVPTFFSGLEAIWRTIGWNDS
jgi:hypothetical protein